VSVVHTKLVRSIRTGISLWTESWTSGFSTVICACITLVKLPEIMRKTRTASAIARFKIFGLLNSDNLLKVIGTNSTACRTRSVRVSSLKALANLLGGVNIFQLILSSHELVGAVTQIHVSSGFQNAHPKS
jgi:hypothetical protein